MQVAEALRERYFGDFDLESDSNYETVWGADRGDPTQRPAGVEPSHIPITGQALSHRSDVPGWAALELSLSRSLDWDALAGGKGNCTNLVWKEGVVEPTQYIESLMHALWTIGAGI